MCEVMWWGFFSKNRLSDNNKNKEDVHAASPSSEDWHKIRFRAHYDGVRGLVPNERLLEYHPSEGWEPLCKFLGREVPDKPFPRVNASGEFGKIMNGMVKDALKRYCIKLSVLILPVAILFIYKHTSSKAK